MRARPAFLLGAALASLLLAACANQNPNERVTGTGGGMIRYSSRQVMVDLTPAERETLERVRHRGFARATPDHTIEAVAAALKAEGYAPVTSDAESGIVEGGRSKVLIPKWHEVLRGALKQKFGALPAKPDHQYTVALVSVRADGHGGAEVRARFENTVYDSNGDSKTRTLIDSASYDDFFKLVGAALNGEPIGKTAESAGTAEAPRPATATPPPAIAQPRS
ncbi:hypothetical protein [Burkholderia cenocepacia]|uniref:hypothetical protein n=1 Tax=Burkholderia cenocepacia TaxID=95486 RepID=UPI002AB60ECC|nr:hypothetical protein [Burkholderia cenocepacia]